jgi:hypothetical protein
MTWGEWLGLILFVVPVPIILLVDWHDLWLFATGRETISEYIWAARDLWRAGQGPFPWRSVYLPALVSLMPIGLWIHFWT